MASFSRPGRGRDHQYSDLEVVSDNAHHAPEVDLRRQQQPDKEAVFYSSEKQYNAGYTGDKRYNTPTESKPRICGMRKPIAFVVFGIIGIIIVAAAVAGGAVGAMQSSNDKSESPTTSFSAGSQSTTSAADSVSTTSTSTSLGSSSPATSTSTASATATPIGEGLGTYTCPQDDNKDYTTSASTDSFTFRQLCDVDWPVGVTAADGSATSDVEDLSAVIAYSLTACIDQCGVYSLNNSPECMAVKYAANLTRAQEKGYEGNCWLKSARGKNNLKDTSGQSQAAYLIGN